MSCHKQTKNGGSRITEVLRWGARILSQTLGTVTHFHRADGPPCFLVENIIWGQDSVGEE